MDLKSKMSEMGGDSLFDSFNNKPNFEDGGIVEPREEVENEFERDDIENMSREELLELLRNS